MTAPTPASDSFTLHLFGPLQAQVRGKPLPHLRSRKGYWLLALLALRGNREVERQWLIGLLWPDSPPELAAHSLRTSLNDLRRALGPEAARLRSPTPRTLVLDLTGAAVDVLAFDAATRRGTPPALAEAVALYQGPLLEGCGETWAFEERQARELAFLGALERLADQALQTSDPTTAERHLRRVVATDPFRESAQRALMRVLAAGGNYGAALQVFRDLRQHLYRELNTHPDLETQQLFAALQAEAGQQAGRGDRSPKPEPGATREAVRHNLPHALTHFIGREREIAILTKLLAGSAARLVTLTGVGGAGKSRLVIEAGRQLVAAMADGAWLVELASLSDPALVPQAVAAVLNVREEAGQPLLPALIGALQSRQLLLILDNCEHLVDACAHLVEVLLQACPGLRILATSREALGIAGERLYPIPPLSLPELPRPDAEPTALLQSEAVLLFLDRATQLLPDYVLTEGNAAATAAVCRRLDGLPLAIELAAGRLRLLSVEEIEARLDDRFRLLTNGNRTAPPRHQTLRAALDWSYELLSPPEQVLLRRLSVFAGSFTVAAVEAVCSEGEEGFPEPPPASTTAAAPRRTIERHEILSLLTELEEKSLIVGEPCAGEVRHRLLETVREFAAEPLSAAERAVLKRKHALYYLELAEQAECHYQRPDQEIWRRRIASEAANLWAVLDGAIETREVEIGLRLMGALRPIWFLLGQVSEIRQRVEKLLALPQADVPPRVRARALAAAARVAGHQANWAGAYDLYRQSLAFYHETEDREGIARVLYSLSIAAFSLGDPTTARSLGEQSLAAFHELEDPQGAAEVLHHLGSVAQAEEDYRTARTRCEDSLTLIRELANPRMLIWALNITGQIAQRQGDLDAAWALHTDAEVVGKQLGDSGGWTEMNLGHVARFRGDVETAHRWYEQALAGYREIGDERTVNWIQFCFGQLALERGDGPAARATIEHCRPVFREFGEQTGIAHCHLNLGHLDLAAGDTREAGTQYRQALKLFQELGEKWPIILSLEAFARLAATQAAQAERADCKTAAARAARLFGAAQALRELTGAELLPVERVKNEGSIEAVRSVLGEEPFDRAWSEGQALPTEQAIAYALMGTLDH